MQINGKDGKKYDLSLACEDIIAHEKLTDEVSALHLINVVLLLAYFLSSMPRRIKYVLCKLLIKEVLA